MYKIGLSTNGKDIDANLFRAYREAGISVMEISLDASEYDVLDFEQLRRWAEEYEIELWSLHLPFGPFEVLDISRRELCEYTVSYWSELMKKAAGIGIRRFIVHPSGEPIKEEEREERLNCAKESLACLAGIAAEAGAVIAVEDLPRTCLGRNSGDMLQLLSADPRLCSCFDTNHLLQEDPGEYIRKVGKRIITTHVSDYDFINERHWLPGEGKLDWNVVLDALQEIGYEGPWLYEIGFACPDTIFRDRDLTCQDFVRNAGELFERKAPTVFSRKKENLGMWG